MSIAIHASLGSGFSLGIIPGMLSWRLRFQKDDKILKGEKRNYIESKIKDLAQKMGISKPVDLIEKRGLVGLAQAQGVAIFSVKAGIAIDPDLVNEIPEEELEFLIAHELSHIKANDIIWLGVVPSIVGVIATLAMSILFPLSMVPFSSTVMFALFFSPAGIVVISVSTISFFFFSKWREECADKLGFSVCSEETQKSAHKFFDRIRISQIEHRNNGEGSYFSRLWRRYVITEDGEFRLDVMHPSLKHRINYLKPIL